MVAKTTMHHHNEERISTIEGVDGKDDPIHLHCSIPSTIIASKRVRFSVDERGRAKLQVFQYEQDAKTCLDELYYSQEEIMDNQRLDRSEAKAYVKHNKEYRRCLKDAIEGKDTTERKKIVDHIIKASEADVRGLESSITNLFRAQRKLGVLQVLELQQRMKAMTCHQSNLQRQSMLELGLRARSSEVSRPARNLALLFAEADKKALES